MGVIDFTGMPKRNKAYAGANGKKISVLYDGEQYMLKFPSMAKKNPDMSYSNSCFSEYLGCQIFEIAGIPVQKTLLGTFTVNGTEKIVVACGDFTRPGLVLQDFASLKNQIIDSERNGYGTELSDILHTITAQTAIDAAQLLDRFWDMFIVDALIGNWDRHNGNWGFLYDAVSDAIELARSTIVGVASIPRRMTRSCGLSLPIRATVTIEFMRYRPPRLRWKERKFGISILFPHCGKRGAAAPCGGSSPGLIWVKSGS